MKQNDKKTRAVTLTELLVMMAVMVILLAIAAPVAQKLAQSLGGSGGARNIIDAALTSARAIAVREGQYAGVRFQQDSTGQFYLIFIIDNKSTSLATDFRAVEGKTPIRLPENIGVMDGKWVTRKFNTTTGELLTATDSDLTDGKLENTTANMPDGKNIYFWDACTFSIVFSPSGKLASQTVRVCNQDGITDTTSHTTVSSDKIFNKRSVVDGEVVNYSALFYQDDYGDGDVLGEKKIYGIAAETSRKNFIVFEKAGLAKVAANKRWSECLSKSVTEFVNPYTGELVKKN